MTCSYVVEGIEVSREDEENHPGFDTFCRNYVVKKKKFQSIGGDSEFVEESRMGEFCFDHMTSDGVHVFRHSVGFTGEDVIITS